MNAAARFFALLPDSLLPVAPGLLYARPAFDILDDLAAAALDDGPKIRHRAAYEAERRAERSAHARLSENRARCAALAALTPAERDRHAARLDALHLSAARSAILADRSPHHVPADERAALDACGAALIAARLEFDALARAAA